jgi:adenine-specific DNA methylase
LEKYNFKILSTTLSNGDNIKVELKTRVIDGKDAETQPVTYEIHIQNIRQTPGRYYESIHLQTDSKFSPDITIRVFGFIRQETAKQKTS